MIASVNHNIAASAVQRQLSQHGSRLTKSFERLASGKRINRAADDAVGLSMSHNHQVKSRGLQQYHRNVMVAQNVLSTAEGGVQNISAILLRLKEWTVQAADGTVTDRNRTAIQKAVDAFVSEVDSIVELTKFNGRMLLDGSYDVDVYLPGDKLSIVLNTGSEHNGLTAVELGLIQPKSLSTSFSRGGVSSDVGPDTELNSLDQVIPDLRAGDVIHINGTLPDGSSIDENASFVYDGEGTTMEDLIREINSAFQPRDTNRGATASIVQDEDGNYTGVLRLTDNSLPTSGNLSQTNMRLTVVPGPNFRPPILTGNALDFSSPLSVTGDVGFSFISLRNDEELMDLDDVAEGGRIRLGTAQATVTGDDVVSLPHEIDDTNDEFVVEIINDGISTGQKIVTLTPGEFDLDELVTNINSALDDAFGEHKVEARANNGTITFTTVDYTDTLRLEGVSALADLGFVSTFESEDGNNGRYESIDVLVGELNRLIANNSNLSGKITAKEEGSQIGFEGTGEITSLDIHGGTLNRLEFPTPTPNDYTRSLFDPADFTVTQAGGSLDVSTREAALNSISIVDTAIDIVGRFLVNVGGLSARFTRVESTLSSEILNTENVVSVISDTDYAVEIAQLTRDQILQQSGLALLAQANIMSEAVLSLLP